MEPTPRPPDFGEDDLQAIFSAIRGLRNLPLASVNILVVWGTIIWMSIAIWRHYQGVAVAQLPYFI